MRLDKDLLVAVYSSVLIERGALYCSAPITSGRRYIEWIRQRGHEIRDVDHAAADFKEEHHQQVINPNLAHARDIVNRLRALSPVPIIDPTAVPHISTWSQSDWLQFWEVVIGRFAIGVMFVDDWQFSYGCAHEFIFAYKQGLPTFSESGQPLDLANGRALITAAVEEIKSVGISTMRLEETLRLDYSVTSGGVHTPMALANFLEFYVQHASKRRDT